MPEVLLYDADILLTIQMDVARSKAEANKLWQTEGSQLVIPV